jgi:hypothetical protein
MQAIDYIFIIKHPGSVPRNDYPDSAALLLGMLSELSEKLPHNLSENDLSRLKSKGAKTLKDVY